ncbi:MAG: alpha/beta hydrolase [Alphaproteobacteria bacterium]
MTPRHRATLIAFVAVAGAAVWLWRTDTFSRAIEAAQLVAGLAAGESGGSAMLPARTTVTYAVAGRTHGADVYPAAGEANAKARAALILVAGAIATGKDDPRLVALAHTLAKARFEVFVPDLPRVRELKLSSADALDVADAVQHLAASSPAPERLGVVGVSYALGPVVLAALDPAVGGKIAFIVGIGGYYDLDAVLAFFTTGYYRPAPGGPPAWRRPNDYGKWLFVLANVDWLSDSHDAALLSSIARRRLDDPAADIADLRSGLGPEGRAVLAFAENKDLERVPELFAGLPAGLRREVAALDLKTKDLSHLAPRFLLLHGRDDAIIPDGESVKLEAALPEGRADLFLLDRFAHVDVEKPDFATAFTLWRAALRLLELRDGAD